MGFEVDTNLYPRHKWHYIPYLSGSEDSLGRQEETTEPNGHHQKDGALRSRSGSMYNYNVYGAYSSGNFMNLYRGSVLSIFSEVLALLFTLMAKVILKFHINI